MKKIIIAFFVSFSLLQFFNAKDLKAQTINTDTSLIIVRVYEIYNNMVTSEILISYGNGKTETVELENAKDKNRVANLDRINYVFSKILNMGYELIGTVGGDIYGTYIFRKKKM